MENDTQSQPIQFDTHPNTSSTLKLSTAASAVAAEQVFHPVETAIRRVQVFNQKINSGEKIKAAVFQKIENTSTNGNALSKSSFAKPMSLFDGFVSNTVYKSLTRPYKFFFQPYAEKKLEDCVGSQLQNYIDEKKSKIVFDATTGAVTGLGEIFIFYPLDSIKIKRQLWDNRSWLKLIKEEKLSLYNGFNAAASRNVLGSGILFGGYDVIMALYHHPEKPTATQGLVASTSAAILSSVLTNPFDVVKTRVQAQKNENVAENLSLSMINAGPQKLNYRGFFSMAGKIIKEEGVTALGKGSFLKCLRALPSLAAPMFMFNMVPQWWEEYTKNENTHKQSQMTKK